MKTGGMGRCQGGLPSDPLQHRSGSHGGKSARRCAHADRPRSVTIVFDPEPPAARETSNG